jgi:ribonucleoside-diphosphate reductase beta chain
VASTDQTAAPGAAGAQAIRRAAEADPLLAARAVLMTMPAAAARVQGTLAWEIHVKGLERRRVTVSDGRARVEPAEHRGPDAPEPDFRIETDPEALVDMATGSLGGLRMAFGRRVRVKGRRRRAMRLRAMAEGPEPTMADVVAAGGTVEPDVAYRLLPYLIDPEWTVGRRFCVGYHVTGDGGGRWYVHVRDGEALEVSTEPPEGGADGIATVSMGDYQRLAGGELAPIKAMQERRTEIEGEIYGLTLMGRWIERAQGRDGAELEREARQRTVQAARAGLWGASAPAQLPSADGQGDPGHLAERSTRDGDLLDYGQLYALWERQNWRAHELDFSQDKEHWLATPGEGQESTIWSLGSFYVGEERVTADLAPFLRAAPTGEIEAFLATQLVDEARHAVFFDRFGAEVMCLEADDFRGRMREVESRLREPWRAVFDDGLRDVSERIKADPHDPSLFVEGVAVYHMVVEGFLAVTGQTFIRGYMEQHGIYPGFCEGFGLVERDEHRHIAFGVRCLKDAIEANPDHRATIERTVLELVPTAALVLVPPYAEDPSDFMSYGYHSSEMYSYAYRTLKRRMAVLGIEVPPPEELMPGPIERPAQPRELTASP